MFSIRSLEDLNALRESHELECKLAQGQNGQGEVPKDFWPTYSAMANTHGGVVLLGVREKSGTFSLAGLPNPAKERAGSGVPKIRSGWAEAGHGLELRDSFEPFDHTLLSMLWAQEDAPITKTSEETSEETAQRILGLLQQSPAWSARQLASQLRLSQRAVELHLAKLKAAHKLKRVGPNKGGRWEVLP